ncbi:unnamed protein product [Moneuplotes crassus]|uniref:MATE efflux family protein n=1 Tax=Euplotes crassus TaxID=5936 RepID=A0AAD1UID3_EUPCR|nr:unnamed protein product [Moneuplotes crassus]
MFDEISGGAERNANCRRSVVEKSLLDDQEVLGNQSFIGLLQAMTELAKRAIPAFFGAVFKHLIDISNIFFAGKIASFAVDQEIYNASDIIAGVGLGILCYNVFIFSVAWGMSSTIDTLTSQAFGSQKYHLCGYYLNRYRVVSTVLFLFQCILLLNIGDILIMIGQAEISCRVCQIFIKYQLIGLFCSVQFEGLRRYLIAQGVYNMIVYIQCISFFLHVGMLSIISYNFGLEVESISYINLLTNIISLVLLTLFCMKTSKIHREGWHYELGSFEDLTQFINLAVPSTMMRCLEYWVCELIMIFSGWCGVKDQAAAIAIFNVFSALYRLISGISMATSNLVGNCLGNNDAKNAKQYALASLCVTFVPIILCTNFMYFCRYQIMSFSSDQEVIEIGASLMIFFVLICPSDFIQGSQFGVLTGMGYQKYGSMINILSYFLFLIPLAYVLGFVYGYGTTGIFGAWVLGILVCAILVTSTVFLADWDHLTRKIQERLSATF